MSKQEARLVGLARSGVLLGNGPGPTASRPAAARTAETVALVLDDEAPIPEPPQDVADLLDRLNGHCMELGAQALPSGLWVQRLAEVRKFAEQAPSSCDFLSARVHLRKLAEQLDGMLGEMAVLRPTPRQVAIEDRSGNTPTLFGAAAVWRQS